MLSSLSIIITQRARVYYINVHFFLPTKKGTPEKGCPLFVVWTDSILLGLLAAASVAAHELVDATCGVNELALTGVEGV